MSEADHYLRRAAACETMAEAALEPWSRESHLTAARSWRLLADTLQQVRFYGRDEAADDRLSPDELPA